MLANNRRILGLEKREGVKQKCAFPGETDLRHSNGVGGNRIPEVGT